MAFHGKVVFLTGGASGMGRLAARRLAAAGASVAALDRDTAGLAETARGYAGIHCWPLDVTDRAAVDEAVARTERELGPIDRVMSAAGIMPTARVLEQDPAEIHRAMAVNYTGRSRRISQVGFPSKSSSGTRNGRTSRLSRGRWGCGSSAGSTTKRCPANGRAIVPRASTNNGG